MADSNSGFLFGDDLEAIFDLIDEEDFEKKVEEIDCEITEETGLNDTGGTEKFLCKLCEKAYLSQRGLSRHITAKHTSHEKDAISSTSSKTKSPFHNLQLKQLIEKAAAKLNKDDCFQEYRIVFENFKITAFECLPIWEKVNLLFD